MTRFKGDDNFKVGGVVGGYSSADGDNEASPTLIPLRLDPTTKRLLVDATFNYTGVKDNEAVDADDYGTLVLGTDGSNYQVLSTDSDGHVQVDVLSGGGGTEYSEDAATPATISGLAIMMERDDQLAAVTPAEGDWVSLRSTSKGALWVALADASGDPITSFGGGTEHNEDDAHTTGDAGKLVLAVRNDTLASLVDTDGDYAPLQVNSDGALFIDVADGGTLETLIDGIETLLGTIDSDTSSMATDLSTIAGAVSGSEMQVDLVGITPDLMLGTDFSNVFGTASLISATPALKVEQQGTVTVDLGANNDVTLATLPDTAAGDLAAMVVDLAAIEVLLGTIDADTGAIKTAVEVIDNAISGSEMQVDVVASLPAGDNNIGNVDIVSGTITTVTTLTGAGVAHDGVDSGNPHKIGGRAQSPTAALDEVADNDRVDAAFDRQGRLAVWMGYDVKSADINDASSGNNTIVAAAGAGKRIAVLGYHLISDGTVDYRWEDGAGGTAFTGQLPLLVNLGMSAGYGFQPMWVGTANTLLNLELSAAVNVHGQVSYVVMED